jgi:hypothetical protein
MVRIALTALAVLAALLVAAQFAVPALVEDRIEDRLTEGGGSAEVSVEALPVARLLAGDGDALEVTGSGLDLELDVEATEAFRRLDGFDRVEIELRDVRAGPFEVDDFELTRDGSGPYALRSSATTSGAELLAYGADRLGVPGSSLIPLIGGGNTIAAKPIPVELDMELTSEDGRIMVTSGGGTVAGYPTGPLAELITQAIVVQL